MRVVHPHFHRRRTGVTSHVETMLRTSANASVFESALTGRVIAPALRRATWADVLQADVWHAHRNLELAIGLIVRFFRKRLSVVVTRHSATPPSAWTRFLMRRADAVVALTNEVRLLVPETTDVVPHGVDTTRFTPPADRADAWQALRVGGQRGLGVVGRVRPSKGHADLVEALAPLLAKRADLQVVFIGLVAEKDRAWADSLQARLGDRLVFTGPQADIERWYRGLSILVQPSHSEGFGLTALEGAASGCCVVATRVGEFPRLFNDDATGFLYDAGDIESLRAILERLIDNESLVRETGARAAAHVRAGWDAARESRELDQVYERVVRKRR